MVWVSSMTSRVPVRRVRSLERRVKPHVGEYDPDVGHRRLGKHAGNVVRGQRLFERGEVIELDYSRGDRGVHRRADIAGPGDRTTVTQHRKALVDCTVIAPVEDQHVAPAGDVACESDRESVGIGSGERELPDGEPEAPGELFADPERVLRRQHEGESASCLFLDRSNDGRRGMPHHRPGITEAEIEIPVSVHVGQVRALGAFGKDRETAGPSAHPVHRHAAEQRPASPRVELEGSRMTRGKAALFLGEERLQSLPIQDHARAGVRVATASSAAPNTSSPSSTIASSVVSGASTLIVFP